MLITHEREKLIQAINFFVRNTRKCGKTKLFKLLYFLDFEHFKMTGRSVTGLTYCAWPKGPVPVSLFNELQSPEPDMAQAFSFQDRAIKNDTEKMLGIEPRITFSDNHFTRREYELMDRLAREYRNANSEEMVEATHLENKPWDRIYNKEGRKQQPIPYELAIRPDEIDEITRVANDREELLGRLR
jgi:uncharacterized phage-associated protein